MSPVQRAAQHAARWVIALAFLSLLGFAGWVEGLLP